MAKKKGFGKQTAPKKAEPEPTPTATTTATTTTATATTTEEPTTTYAAAPGSSTMGADALSKLRRGKVEERNEELRKIRELKNTDRQLVDQPDSAVIPEPVAQRMGKRMLPFVGVPLFGGMGAFVAFWYFATYKNYEFQPAMVAFSTIAILAVGLIGITYSVMSASWDVEEEGSALGFDEFQKNLGSISDGFKRTRENAILREKMASVSDVEIDKAIANLNKKELAERKRTMDLEEKLSNELE